MKSIQNDREILSDENVTRVKLGKRVRDKINENRQRWDGIINE